MEKPCIFLESKEIPLLSTYGEANDSSPVAIIGSDGYLELAVKNGSAADALGPDWQALRLTISSKG